MATEDELRDALILAGRRMVKLNFGRRDDPVLVILRRVLRDARHSAQAKDPRWQSIHSGPSSVPAAGKPTARSPHSVS